LLDDDDCQQALNDALVKAGAAGLKCALIGSCTGFAGVFGGIAVGAGAGTIWGGPVGTAVGVVVGGGVEIYDWIHFRHCMDKVDEMKDKAQKDYDECEAKVHAQ
jgi:hypothetical protein